MKETLKKTFSSLQVRNYRLYYGAQFISYSGTFLQALAQDWLVLQLTNSGTLLGIVSALQFLPVLLLTPFGGAVADRFPKIKLLYITQAASGVFSLILGVLVLTGSVKLWMIFVFALLLGLVTSFDNPARQSFVSEIVGGKHVKNALSLWAILISMTRIIGPAIAGILIATVGIGLCFVINAASYLIIIGGLMLMRANELYTRPPAAREKGQIKAGFVYVRSHKILFHSLIMMSIIGVFTFEWQASLPLFAKFVLLGNAATYSYISIFLGMGMLVGGLINAHSASVTERRLSVSALLFGFFVLVTSVASGTIFIFAAFFFTGIFGIMFANLSNAILQLNSDPAMRGRVMSMWAIAFIGSTTIGGPIIGWVGEMVGARWALAVGGVAAIAAALYGFTVQRAGERQTGIAAGNS